MKVVINRCFGGFGLSDEAKARLVVLGAPEDLYDIARNDRRLVAVVEELGEAANGPSTHLRVVEIPDGVKWEIAEYDGLEHVAERHRTWSE